MKDSKYKEDINDRSLMRKAAVSVLALLLALMTTLASCSADAAESGATEDTADVSTVETVQDSSADSSQDETADASVAADDMFTERDLSGEYDESAATKIELKGSSAGSSSESGVSINGSTVTISAEGTYIVSGSLSDGQIIVEAAETDKVQIVLKDASITSQTSAAIYVKSADKVFVTSADGTENTLANGGTFTADGTTNVDGAVFAKDDVVFNGSGSITIESSAGHGIVGKDDVKLAGGTITINAGRHGVQANNSIRVAEANISIDAGKEGMESLLVYLRSGDVKIAAVDDGLNAASDSSTTQSRDGGTDGMIQIEGGKLYITAGGDAIDSNGSVEISGGYTVICGPSYGDTSVLDYNATATITGGTFIATGGAGMAQGFSTVENQGLIAVAVGGQSAGSTVKLTDESGNTIAELTPDLDYAMVYVSTPDISDSGTYTLTAGTYSETIEISNGIGGSAGAGMGGRGGMGHGMRGGMNASPEQNTQTDSDIQL